LEKITRDLGMMNKALTGYRGTKKPQDSEAANLQSGIEFARHSLGKTVTYATRA
jgi:hypothetical protein